MDPGNRFDRLHLSTALRKMDIVAEKWSEKETSFKGRTLIQPHLRSVVRELSLEIPVRSTCLSIVLELHKAFPLTHFEVLRFSSSEEEDQDDSMFTEPFFYDTILSSLPDNMKITQLSMVGPISQTNGLLLIDCLLGPCADRGLNLLYLMDVQTNATRDLSDFGPSFASLTELRSPSNQTGPYTRSRYPISSQGPTASRKS